MADILPFRRSSGRKKVPGMCQHGFHKWKVVTEKKFDVKQGKLVTHLRCERCGEEQVRAL